VDNAPYANNTGLEFQLSKKDLFGIVRISAARRPLRKVAVPVLAGLVFLGHSLDGDYLEGLLWAVGVAVLYWGLSNLMYILNVYGAANDSFLAPQQIILQEDQMVVTSEHSAEEFARPDPSEVKTAEKYLVIGAGKSSLVFLKRSFKKPEDYETLKNWLKTG
jgi:hypothetical protein